MISLTERMRNVRLGANGLVLLGLGQAGVALRGSSQTIYVDPYLTSNDGSGGRMERLFPPPLAPEEVDDASAVLVTHAHIDHFDPETLGPIASASPQALFVGPYPCDFREAGISRDRTVTPSAFEPQTIGEATVTAVPAAHPEIELTDSGYSCLGFIIEMNGVTVYNAGDTVIYDQDEKSATPALLDALSGWDIDVMFVPINGRDWFRTAKGLVGNTNAQEAVLLAEELDVRLVVPTHYDLIPGNTVNPAHFVDILYRTNAKRPHHLLRPGELCAFVK